jgi:hypothetical protein
MAGLCAILPRETARMYRRFTIVVGCGVALAIAGALAAISPAQSAAGRSRHVPPRPRVRTLGVTRPAELVSYCWTYDSGDNMGSGQCADGAVSSPTRTLRWRSAEKFVVGFGLPAHHVGIEAIRLKDGRERHVVWAHPAATTTSGRRWVFRLPRSAARDNVLIVSATFPQGDVAAEVGIHRGTRR